ncbi:hypothetical protein niasHT_033469 [Heterodera trifolii]|uniref:Secreted protein n=1 Tax=Heterodera trifolii TaxID=157864 RepID=A0ABD2J5Z5_9BILA
MLFPISLFFIFCYRISSLHSFSDWLLIVRHSVISPPLTLCKLIRSPNDAQIFVPGQRGTAEKAHPMGKQRKKQQIGRSRGGGKAKPIPGQ